MIFVTIGTSPYGFKRLIKEMDIIAGKIDEEVIMQIGDTDYEPRHARCFRYTSRDDILNYYSDARIIIACCNRVNFNGTSPQQKSNISAKIKRIQGSF